jgi:hypothetical protein
MPGTVRLLIALLFLTAFSTAAAEVLNWWFTRDADYGLFVRTTWALIRSLAFLLVIWQVRRGRATAPPFALILAATTLFALGRLVIPKQGMPSTLGIAAFAWVALLSAVVLFLLYRSAEVREYLSRHPSRVVFTSKGVEWKAMPPRRPPIPGWLLTARVAALSYGPLVVVAAAVAMGRVFAGRVDLLTVVLPWLVGGLALAYVMGLLTIFLIRGKRWSATALLWLTLLVLAVDLPLCWLVLGVDGLVRDGGPLAVAALLALVGLARRPVPR